MKLLLCKRCSDVRALASDKYTVCRCRSSRGKYTENGLDAEFSGKHAVLLGFANGSLVSALREDTKLGPDYGSAGEYGVRFEAFVIPQAAPTIKRLDKHSR